jgi:hypothetical protein
MDDLKEKPQLEKMWQWFFSNSTTPFPDMGGESANPPNLGGDESSPRE